MIRRAHIVGSLSTGLLIALVAVSGCAPIPSLGLAVHTAHQPAEGPCTAEPGAASAWRSEVSSFRLTVMAPDMESPIGVTSDGGELMLEEVPAGEGRTVGLFGLIDGSPAWRGVTPGVRVEVDAATDVNVLLARLGSLSCARGPDERRAFHTATVLADGRVLIVGGASTNADIQQTCGAGCRQLEASATAAIYDPTTGLFQRVANLAQPRMFHTATLLGDGRVVVAGGTARARVHAANDAAWPFPIEPNDPTDSVEVFDPVTNQFTSAGADPNGPRVFAAAALAGDGRVVITGGVPGVGSPNNLGNAVNTTTLCGGTPVACAPGPRMAFRRAGHTAFRVDGEANVPFTGMLVWGGSIDVTAANAATGFELELLRDGADGSSALETLDVAAMNASRNLFFATGARYTGYRMLIAGGLSRTADGTFRLATTNGAGTGGPVLVFDPIAGGTGAISTGPGSSEPPMALTSGRLFAAAAPLPGGTRAVIAGGYTDLDLTPTNALELFDQTRMAVTPITIAGEPRTLREGRGGVAAAANGDGTVMFFGGTSGGSDRSPLPTAELYADPVTPPGVGE